MGTYLFIGAMLFFLSWIEGNSAYAPIGKKRKVVLFSSPTTWNNAAAYCSSGQGGSLVTERSPPMDAMLKRYREAEWKDVWNGTKAWLGLFIENSNIPNFNWLHNCKSVNVSDYHRFGTTVPSASSLEPDKLCGYNDFSGDSWKFENCTAKLSAVCAKKIGPCTYQRGTEQNVCLKEISFFDVTSANSQGNCEEICSNLPTNVNGECWAVTYIPHSNMCFPSFSMDPYAFETTNNTFYENPCAEPRVTMISNETSVVSWKRCFDDPSFDPEPIPNLYPIELEPLHNCSVTVSQSTPTTTQSTQSTTQTQELFYTSTNVKRRLILLEKHATFNDAASHCLSEYNGTLLTHDSWAIGVMLNTYQTNEWHEWQDALFWDGIFVSDLDVPLFTYQSNCFVLNKAAFHRFTPPLPMPGTMDPSQLCVKGDFETEAWYIEKCNDTLSAICEQVIGPCTFERDSGDNSCTVVSSTFAYIYADNLTECESYCSLFKPEVWDKDECWAVTYLPEFGHCIPAIHKDPLHFDTGTLLFENPCQQSAIMSLSSDGSVVSWRRCFKDPIYDTADVPAGIAPNDEPSIWCDSPLSVTSTPSPTTLLATSSNLSTSTDLPPDTTSIPTTTATNLTPVTTSIPTTTTNPPPDTTSTLTTTAANLTPDTTPIPTTTTNLPPDTTSIPTTTATNLTPVTTSIPTTTTNPPPDTTSTLTTTAANLTPDTTPIPTTTTNLPPDTTSIPTTTATNLTPVTTSIPTTTTNPPPDTTSILTTTAANLTPDTTPIPTTTTNLPPDTTSIPTTTATNLTPDTTSIPTTTTNLTPDTTSIPTTTTNPPPDTTSILTTTAANLTPDTTPIPTTTDAPFPLGQTTIPTTTAANLTPYQTPIPTTPPPKTTTTVDPVTDDRISVTSKAPGEPSCECTCVIVGNMTLQEKMLAMKKELTINKEKTSAHARTLTSANDDRPSARGVGITIGVGMLVGVLVIVTLGDAISFSKFLYTRLLK